MSIRALSGNVVVIALAAFSCAGTAAAGHLLCEDGVSKVLELSSCPNGDKDHAKDQQRIERLFDAGPGAHASDLSDHLNSIETRHNSGDHRFAAGFIDLSGPLGSSHGWGFGNKFEHGNKWTEVQLHGGPPSRSVPEPGSLALLGIGLVAASLARRLNRS